MAKKHFKFNTWKFIQFTGFFLITLGIIFSFFSFKVSLLLYFGLVSVLIGSINILIYYIFIGTNSYKKYSRKQNNNKLIIKNN
ncbi:hypothetical protein [Spiroplasma endosymbiont of Danaus chrysippus]|uniref:hypothetical protein n=1 Tax=Spiroplasma endosymbiont of Danaus chrysippus TaxID=2691041 RepID=UPI00157AE958|nr:hypothetical protein [Spiroplasma endosymbiont of Danaus chrysippus]